MGVVDQTLPYLAKRSVYNIILGIIFSPGRQNSSALATVSGVLGGFIGLLLIIVIALAIALGVSQPLWCNNG